MKKYRLLNSLLMLPATLSLCSFTTLKTDDFFIMANINMFEPQIIQAIKTTDFQLVQQPKLI